MGPSCKILQLYKPAILGFHISVLSSCPSYSALEVAEGGYVVFTKRSKNSSIIYASTHFYGVRYDDTVKNGDHVTLLVSAELVLVENVQVVSSSSFRGRIYGFQPSCTLEFNGLKIHDEIEFEEAHIHTCYR